MSGDLDVLDLNLHFGWDLNVQDLKVLAPFNESSTQ